MPLYIRLALEFFMLAATPALFRRVSFGVLVYNVAVILWGAYVRATGSGAGCGEHWPMCNGQVIPHSPSITTLIEFTHRSTSGIDLVATVLMLGLARQAYEKGHPARTGAGWVLGFILSEAALGAGLVLFGLVDKNASGQRAVAMSLHLVNTFLLLASLTLTAQASVSGARLRYKGQGWIGLLLCLGLGSLLLLGVSGAIVALGDTLFPAKDLAWGMAQDFSPTAHFLIRLRVIHPVLALGAGAWVVVVAVLVASQRSAPQVRHAAYVLGGLFLAQLGAGVANLVLLAPVWMQLVHLLLADLVWISLVWLAGAALSVPVQEVEQAQAPLAGLGAMR